MARAREWSGTLVLRVRSCHSSVGESTSTVRPWGSGHGVYDDSLAVLRPPPGPRFGEGPATGDCRRSTGVGRHPQTRKTVLLEDTRWR